MVLAGKSKKHKRAPRVTTEWQVARKPVSNLPLRINSNAIRAAIMTTCGLFSRHGTHNVSQDTTAAGTLKGTWFLVRPFVLVVGDIAAFEPLRTTSQEPCRRLTQHFFMFWCRLWFFVPTSLQRFLVQKAVFWLSHQYHRHI